MNNLKEAEGKPLARRTESSLAYHKDLEDKRACVNGMRGGAAG